MSDLTPRENELVALGAALGSNCVPCIEYHIPQARQAGLTDHEIHVAIQHADKVRQVPARKVLEVALNLLPEVAGSRSNTESGDNCDIGSAGKAQEEEIGSSCRSPGAMKTIMSRMMSSCGPIVSACGERGTSAKKPDGFTPREGHGCC